MDDNDCIPARRRSDVFDVLVGLCFVFLNVHKTPKNASDHVGPGSCDFMTGGAPPMALLQA